MERHPLRRVHGRTIFLKGALFASTALVFPVMAPRAALAQISQTATPQGGQVVGGSASITQAPASTTVNQASQLAAINWQSFNVGANAKVQFNQPDQSAVALNRVVGGDLSQINGQINANGQIVLINQSGVVFGRGSQVNAESVVVSTSDIATSDFMAGKMNFSGAPKPGAQIVNNGNISARDAGLVGLVAPQVLNNGVITAQLGQVVLAGGSAFTLDLYGDRLISLDVTQAVRAVDVGGKLVPALVTNSGLILADGGKVTLTAQDADALVTQLINAGGTIQANTVGQQTGTISLSGVGGNINIAGNLIAAGTGNGQKGGAIQALATGTVSVAPTAQLVASGQAGGGVIALGTDLSRAETGPSDSAAPAASNVTIAQGATIRADATGIGNGGTVTLLSQDFTDFAGNISVLGGPQGGHGGLAEISSRGVISLSGTVADLAIDGRPGEILLDPATLIVTAGGAMNTTSSEVDNAFLGGLSGNVVLSASSLLEVLSAVKSTSLDSLSLVSGGNVSIDALISLGGSLEVDATGFIQVGPSFSVDGQGHTIFSDTGGLDAKDIYLNGTTGISLGATIDTAFFGNGTLALDSQGPITQTAFAGTVGTTPTSVSGVIQTETLSGGTAAIGGNVLLNGSLNAVAGLDNFTLASGGTLQLADTIGLAIAGVTAPNATFISSDGADTEDFDITGLLDASNVLVLDGPKLTAESNNASVITGELALFGGGDVSLTSAHNSVTTLVVDSGIKNLFLDDGKILNINSSVGIGTVFSFTGAGINENGGGLINVPTFDASPGVAGDINLTGANSIANFIGSAAGNISVNDTAALDIPGLVSAASVFISLAPNDQLEIAGGGAISAGGGANAVLSLIIDSIFLPGATPEQISAIGGTIIVAPATANRAITFTDLDGGTGLVLGPDFLTDIVDEEANLQLGTAGSTGAIILGTSQHDQLALGDANLSLVTTGAVTQAGILSAGTLAFNTGNFRQTTGQAELELADFTGTAASGVVSLATGANLIGAFGPVTAKGTIDLADNEAANITGAISTSGTIILDNAGAGYTETGAGALDAATLATGPDGIDGSALLGGANGIGTIANFEVLGTGSNISFNNTAALAIDGEISTPGEVIFNDTAAGITELTGGFISAASLATSHTIGGDLDLGSNQNTILAFGPITASGNIVLGDDDPAAITGLISTTGAITLQNAAGGFTETGAGALSAATLTTGAGQIAGETDLSLANTIGTLAAFDLASGNFTLDNSEALIIDGAVTVPGEFTILDSSAGVTEASGGVLTVGTLYSDDSDIGGNALFGNTANVIGNLGLDATGTVSVADNANLTIFDNVEGSSVSIALAKTDALTVAGLTTAVKATGNGGVLSIIADSLVLPTNDPGALAAPNGTIAIAPATASDSITVTDQSNSGTGLVLGAAFFTDLGTAKLLQLGDAAMTGGIQLGTDSSDFENFGAGNLLLLTGGNIAQDGALTAGTIAFTAKNFSQAGTGDITAAYLSGTVTGQQISLSGANAIGTLGALSAPDDILVTDSDAAGLVLDGLLSVNTTGTITLENLAGGVSEDGSGLLSGGTLTTGAGTIGGDADFGNGNTIADLADFTASGNILLQDTGTLSINGAVFTPESLTLEDFSGGIFQATGGITAATLSSGGEIDGKVSLTGANTITTISNFQLASAFGLQLADTGSLTAAGTVSAQNIILSDSNGTIFLTGGLSAPGLVDLAASDGIYQSAGSLTAGTFTGAVSGTGDLSLTSTHNSFANVGDVSLNNGSFLLTDLTDVLFTGTVSTPDSLILSVSSIGESGTGAIDAGTLDNQLALSSLSLGGQNQIASLAGDFVLSGAGNFFLNDLTFLTLTTPIRTGGDVTFGGAGLTQAPFGFIEAATLSGAGAITGDVLLTSGNNNIGALDNLTLAGTLDVANSGNLSLDGISAAAATFSNNNLSNFLNFTGPVSVNGALELDFVFGNYDGAGNISAGTLDTAGDTANNLSLTGANSIGTVGAFTSNNDFVLNDTTTLNIAGALTAPTIALASPEILLNAAVTAGGFGQPGTIAIITDGITAAAGIQFNAQTGTIEIEPLTDSIIDLGGNTAGELDLPGAIFGAADEIVIGNLPLGNPLGAGSQANSIVVDAGSFGPGLVILSAADGIFDNGVLTADTIAFDGGGFVQTQPTAQIIANTLYADAGITGLVSLTSHLNQIGALGSIDGSAGVDVTDAILLTVDGPITATDIALADSVGIDIAGAVSASSGGTIALRSAALTPETGGTITADLVQISPFVAGEDIDLGGTSFGGLEISQALLNIIGAGILRIGIAGGSTIYAENQVSVSAPELVLTSGSIDIFGTLTGGTLLSLASAGGISESVTGNIDFATLTGFGGEVALTGANSFATLAAFSASSDLAINDDQAMTIAGFVTTAGTLSLEDSGYIIETTGTLAAATLDSGVNGIGGDLRLTNSNTIGALGNLTLAGTLDLIDTGPLEIAGTVFAPIASLSAANIVIAGALDGTDLLLATPGSITETTGTIAAATLAGGVIGGAVSLLQSNQIGTIQNLLAGGAIGINDGEILTIAGLISTASTIILEGAGATEISTGTLAASTLTSDGTVIDGNVLLSNANPIGTLANFDLAAGGTLALDVTGALDLTGEVTAPNAYLTASSISFAGLETFAQILALESPGEILQAAGTITAGTITSLGSIGGDTELLDQNTIANLGAFTVAAGATLAIDSTHLFTILGTVNADFATFASDTIAIAGSIIGTQLALQSSGDIFETTGAISEATLTSGGTTIGGALALGNGNDVNTLGVIAALGGITLNNFQSLDIAGQITTPAALILQARGGVTEIAGGAITAGTFGTGSGTISGALTLLNGNSISHLGNLVADGGIALNDLTPLDIAGFVTTAGAILLEGKGGISETGTLDAATLTTGSTTYAGNVILDGSNAIPGLGNFTLAAGDTLDLADSGFLAVSGTVFAPIATITTGSLNIEGALDGTFLALGAKGTLAESSGSISVGTLVSDGTIGGVVVLGNKNNKIGTLGAFAADADIFLNDGEALGLAGRLATPGTLTLEDAAAGITELAGGAIAAATLNSGFTAIGGDVLLTNPNTIGALGAFTVASGDSFTLIDTGLLTVAGTVNAAALTLDSPTIAIAGALDATALALESTGDIFETAGTIAAATLTSGGTDIGGFLSLTNANSINTLGGITATGNILINDGAAETIAGLVTTGQTITLEGAQSITETTGRLDALELTSGNTTIGGNLILNNQNSIATLANVALAAGFTLSLTDTQTLTLAGTVLAQSTTFSAPGLIFDGILDAGQVLALTSATSVTEGPDGGIVAGTLTSLGTVDGDVILGGAHNTIGNIQNFSVGSSSTFDLADNGLLTVSGPLTGGFVTLAPGSLSITSVITAPNLALEALTGVTETGGTLIDAFLSTGGTTIGGNIALGGANTVGTLGDVFLTGNFLLANTGTLTLEGALATPNGDVTLEDNASIIETSGAITAATLDSGGTTLGGDLRLANANTIGTLGNLTLATGTLALADATALTIAGTVFAPIATISAASIALAGALDGTSLTLSTTGALTETTGTITAGTLTLPAIGGDASLLEPNAIGTLANASASGNIAFDDLLALSIDGLVATPGIMTLEDAGAVTELPGGILAAATLTTGTGSIGGAASLTNQNQIGAIGAFDAAGNISFTDSQTYAISGLVSTPGALDLSGQGFAETTSGGVDAATLLSTGTIQGNAILNQTNTILALGGFGVTGDLLLNDAGPLSIVGTVTAGHTVGLAAIGNVIEAGAGAIRAASLTTGGGEIVGEAILNGANSVSSLGAFTATSALLFSNTGALNLAGVIAAGGTFGLADNGGVTELAGATITATSFTTDGGEISGSANLGQAANQIGTIGGVTVGLGLALADSRALDFAGDVLTGAPGLSLTDTGFAITQSGGTITTRLLNASAQNITLGGHNDIDDLGLVLASGNATINSEAAAGLTLGSTVSAGSVLSLSSAFGLNEAAAATLIGGTIDLQTGGQATLAGINLAAGDFNFNGPRATLTQTGGTIAAGGTAAISAYYGFSQNAGRLDAADIVIETTTGVTLAGVISASNSLIIGTGGTLTDNAQYLAAANAGFSGNVINLGGVNLISGRLTASGGQIVQAGTGVIDAGTLELVATGGSMPVYGLSLTGAIHAGNATLSGPGIELAGYLSVASLLQVNAVDNIDQSGGLIIATGAPAQFNAGTRIVLGGSDDFAAGLAASAGTTFAQTGQLNAAYASVFASDVVLRGGISITNALSLTGFTQIDDEAASLFAQTADFAAPVITLNGANAFAAALTATATGGIVQNNAAASLFAPGATLTGADITLDGTDSFSGALDLIASGNIFHTSTDTLTAGTLIGSAAQTAAFTGKTDFGTIGSFIMQDSTFVLDNDNSLTIIGPLAANQVTITAVGQITLDGAADGGLFISGVNEGKTATAPTAIDSVFEVLPNPGSSTASILQTGTFFINSGPEAALIDNGYFANLPATLYMLAFPGDNLDIAFAPAPPGTDGLYGPSVSVAMALGALGTGTGNANLYEIIIFSGASTSFTGTLDNLGGPASAGKGFVVPFPKPPLQFNACPIGSVNCVILPSETLPSGNPLQNFDVTQRKRRHLAKSVVLPGVATRDF